MAQQLLRQTRPPGGAGFGEPLSAARTVLVLTPSRSKAGDLAGALQDKGLPTVTATTPRQAAYWMREEPPALVLIDLDVQRAQFLVEHFRHEGRSVVAISNDVKARAQALQSGCLSAEARLSPEELALKMASLLRERRLGRSGTIEAGPLIVDLSRGQLVWRGTRLAVPPVLLDLTACLAARTGEFVSIAILLEEVWSEPWAEPAKVHRAIWRLRKRLPGSARFIASKWGYGYGLFPDAAGSLSSTRARPVRSGA